VIKKAAAISNCSGLFAVDLSGSELFIFNLHPSSYFTTIIGFIPNCPLKTSMGLNELFFVRFSDGHH
jgi:hypothetical protein